MMTKHEEMKLKLLKEELGDMSSETALNLAIDYECTIADIGPFDPNITFFLNLKYRFEKYALLLEKAGL